MRQPRRDRGRAAVVQHRSKPRADCERILHHLEERKIRDAVSAIAEQRNQVIYYRGHFPRRCRYTAQVLVNETDDQLDRLGLDVLRIEHRVLWRALIVKLEFFEYDRDARGRVLRRQEAERRW